MKIRILRGGVLLTLLIAAAAAACNENTTVGDCSYNGSNWTVEGTLDFVSHTDEAMDQVQYKWDAIPYPATLTVRAGAPFTPQTVRVRMVIYTDSANPADGVIDESCPQDMMDQIPLASVSAGLWGPENVRIYTTNIAAFVHYKVQSSGDDASADISSAQFTLSKECP